MSPEQYAGGDVDALSDQFSFCAALYEALYGYLPFPGETLEELKKSVQGAVRPRRRERGFPSRFSKPCCAVWPPPRGVALPTWASCSQRCGWSFQRRQAAVRWDAFASCACSPVWPWSWRDHRAAHGVG